MKSFVLVLLVLGMIVGLAVTAGATSVTYTPDGATNLTGAGWYTSIYWGASSTRSGDLSVAAPNQWDIADNDANKTMRSIKDPGMTDTGIVMGRLRLNTAFSGSGGNFGWSYKDGAHSQSVAFGIQNNGVEFWDAQQNMAIGATSNAVSTSVGIGNWAVYAMQYYNDGGVKKINAWVSNTSDWSNVAGNWTQIVSGAAVNETNGLFGAYQDGPAGSPNTRNGIILGSMGPRSITGDLSVGWVAYSNDYATPWAFNATNAPVPEPSSLLALASFGIAGLGFIRRRRA
jgi:hypothetical protein